MKGFGLVMLLFFAMGASYVLGVYIGSREGYLRGMHRGYVAGVEAMGGSK